MLGAAIALTFATTADAAKKRSKKVIRQIPITTPHMYRQEPARMIEIRPGRWISTWGCYTDEGYGRLGSCDMREGPM
jgi:hypothetical protein